MAFKFGTRHQWHVGTTMLLPCLSVPCSQWRFRAQSNWILLMRTNRPPLLLFLEGYTVHVSQVMWWKSCGTKNEFQLVEKQAVSIWPKQYLFFQHSEDSLSWFSPEFLSFWCKRKHSIRRCNYRHHCFRLLRHIVVIPETSCYLFLKGDYISFQSGLFQIALE